MLDSFDQVLSTVEVDTAQSSFVNYYFSKLDKPSSLFDDLQFTYYYEQPSAWAIHVVNSELELIKNFKEHA